MNSNQEELMANAFYNNIEVSEEVPSTNGIEESEEETITLDFKNMTAYTQPEEKVVVPEPFKNVVAAELGKAIYDWNKKPDIQPTIVSEEPKVEILRTYKDDIQDLIVNKLASQAIASLLTQHNELDNEISNSVNGRKIGQLQTLLEEDLANVMDKRKKELKQCFGIGGRIDFDKIPKWARSYVEDYITNTIVSMCILGEA